MDTTEKKVLKSLCKNLSDSTVTSWVQGYMDDWTKFARTMKNTIHNSVNIIEELIKEDDVKDKKDEKLTL